MNSSGADSGRRQALRVIGYSAAAAGMGCIPNTAWEEESFSLTPDVAGNLILDLSDFPELAAIGDWMNIDVSTISIPNGSCDSGRAPIVVVRTSATEFKAYLNRCGHLGSKLRVDSVSEFRCPCHGSRFSVGTGTIISGPSFTDLISYPTSYDSVGNILTISGLS